MHDPPLRAVVSFSRNRMLRVLLIGSRDKIRNAKRYLQSNKH